MEHRSPAFLALTLAGVLLSALYMARMVWLTFCGSARSEDAEHAHESPALMTVPLVLLAVLAVTLGRAGDRLGQRIPRLRLLADGGTRKVPHRPMANGRIARPRARRHSGRLAHLRQARLRRAAAPPPYRAACSRSTASC